MLPKINLLGITSKLPTHFIGLGGAGSNVLEYIHSKGLQAQYTCITSPERLHLAPDINFIRFDSPEDYYLNDNLHNEEIILSPEIKNVFQGKSRYILLAGLGGYTGTLLGKSLFNFLKENNKEFMMICSYPYSFEGPKRIKIANKTTRELKNSPNFKCFNLEMIREKYGNLPLTVAFEKADEHFYQIYKATNA